MKIGELAESVGVSAKTVRYYESIGLLAEPERTSSNYRDYQDAAAERLRFIRDSQAAGLTLAEVNASCGLALASDDYTTLGGYLFGKLGRLPKAGDRVAVEGGAFEIVTMDGRRGGEARFLRGGDDVMK